jgi:hypothetical protein
MIIVFFQRTLKEKLPIFLINTLLLHIPLLALTDRRNDRGTNTLAVRGLEELKVNLLLTLAVRGLEELFFQLWCCVSFLVSGGKQVLVLHTYVLRVQYSRSVVLVFWFWQDIVFGVTYVLSVQYSCVVVSVFWLWWEIVLKNENNIQQKILIGLLYYDPLADVCIS